MPRAQNSHALVNAGFLFKLDKAGKVLEKPNIIYGGIRPDFVSNRFINRFLVTLHACSTLINFSYTQERLKTFW